MKSAVTALVLAVALAACSGTPPAAPPASGTGVVTTLYLGRSIRGEGRVGDADVRRFVDEVAVAELPDGFTVLHGEGWWRTQGAAATEREDTLVLQVVHAGGDAADAAIRRIADAWKARFRQETVLRTDTAARVAW